MGWSPGSAGCWLSELDLPEQGSAASQGARHAGSTQAMARRLSPCTLAPLAVPLGRAHQRWSVSLWAVNMGQRAKASDPAAWFPVVLTGGLVWQPPCPRAWSSLCLIGLARLWAAWTGMGLRDSGLCLVSKQSWARGQGLSFSLWSYRTVVGSPRQQGSPLLQGDSGPQRSGISRRGFQEPLHF